MPLYCQKIAAKINPDKADNLLLLHGWGIASQIWQPCIDRLSNNQNLYLIDLPGFGNSAKKPVIGLDKLLTAIAGNLPNKFSIIGFSLGGMLAIKLAQQYSQRVSHVVTIASNTVFVAKQDWPSAMAEDVYQQFYQLLQKSPTVALKRFLSLQAKGCDQEKHLLKQLRTTADELSDKNGLLLSLDLLASLDNRKTITQVADKTLCLFGEYDQLVPINAATEIASLGVTVALIKGASHVPFISHTDASLERIIQFLNNKKKSPYYYDKKLNKIRVAKSFTKAAKSYDEVAGLQRDVGHQLLSYLPPKKTINYAVDLGCGTGFFLPPLQKSISAKKLIAFDLAEGMLHFAKQQRKLENCTWLCGDAESIPLADNSVDLFFSSLAIQWCEASDILFAEIYRVLKPTGKFVFSSLGPDTLQELRIAWRAADNYVHVNRFQPEQQIRSAIARAGFITNDWQEQTISLQYPKLSQLTRELKALGAHNVNNGRPQGLMGKQAIKKFRSAYEAQRNEQGFLPATYQVWYGVICKPAGDLSET